MAHPAAAFHTLKLYRDCLRLAEHVGSKVVPFKELLVHLVECQPWNGQYTGHCYLQGGNTQAIKKQIQLQFRKNAGEADPDKVSCG